LWHWGKFGAEDNALAQQFFQRSIDLDPNFAGGYSGLAIAKRRGVQRLGLLERDDVVELARRAVSLDPNDAEARARLGFMVLGQGDYDAALAEVDRVLQISANLRLCACRPRSNPGVLGTPARGAGRSREEH
jgi:adenylate cyclase